MNKNNSNTIIPERHAFAVTGAPGSTRTSDSHQLGKAPDAACRPGPSRSHLPRVACLAAVFAVFASPLLALDAFFLDGFGAVNSAMGGAAAAGNDQDLIGSIYKNPATALLFADRTISIASGDVIPYVRTESSVPALGLSGASDSTVNTVPYMSVMASWRSGSPGLAWFAGAVSEAGLGLHFAASATNPIFMPQAGAAANPFHGLFGGFGDVRSSMAIIRFPVGLAGAAPGNWSWGIALAPSVGRGLLTPAAFAAPSLSATGPVYPTVQHEDVEFGLGAQGGLRCQVDKDLSLGISLSSPTWFHPYSWNVRDATGNPRTITYRMNRPLTAQAGMNYAVTAATHVLVDLGYVAYGSTSGFAHNGFNADGSLAGLGWKDSETIGIGVQQSLTSGVVARAGFNHCSDPIPADMTFCNVGSPLHAGTHLCLGASVVLKPGTTLDLSYVRTFSHSQASAWYAQAGAAPGTNVTSTSADNELAAGITSRF